MVPVINVPIDLRACDGAPGQGGWMGARAAFVQLENYKKKHEKIKEKELAIQAVIRKLYFQTTEKHFSQEDTFEHDVATLNELYNSYKAQEAATEPPVASLQRTNSWRGTALKPPPPPIPPPGFQGRPPAPSQPAPAPPTTKEKYLAHPEMIYVRKGSPEDPLYDKITPATPFFLYTLNDGTQNFYPQGRAPRGARQVSSVEYFVYKKRYAA